MLKCICVCVVFVRMCLCCSCLDFGGVYAMESKHQFERAGYHILCAQRRRDIVPAMCEWLLAFYRDKLFVV